jgi:hypothetical protein
MSGKYNCAYFNAINNVSAMSGVICRGIACRKKILQERLVFDHHKDHSRQISLDNN